MYTLIATENIKNHFCETLSKFSVTPTNPHVITEYKGTTKKSETFDICIFKTGTLTINGSLKDNIYNSILDNFDELDYCGYDEVGVGDFFGPTVYVSVLLDEKSIEIIRNNKISIRDSKKLKDFEILDIYEKIKNITFHKQIVYDRDIDNLNSIAQKTYYHYLNVDNNARINVIDLFTTVNSFYNYSEKLNITYPSNIVLETKADSKFYCVALASIIARALFINEMNKLNEKYSFEFPYGANVLQKAHEFVSIHGKDELASFAKTTFKTFNEV